MPRALIALHVFLLMCAPLPQASYVAVGFGRDRGLAMAVLLLLYALSDAVVVTVIAISVRRMPLPARIRLLLDRTVARAERTARGRATLPALFLVGFASLYSAGVLAGMTRRRLAPALAAAITGDLVQFSGMVALGGVLARVVPVAGGEWLFLLATPLLVTLLPVVALTVRRRGAAGVRLAVCPVQASR